MIALALRMLWRDWRAGEIGFLLVAMVVGVSALSSVSFFAERIKSGLLRDATQLIGADLLISSDHPIANQWRDEAQHAGLTLADTVVFPSMAINPAGGAKLVSLKAVSRHYPLRGQLKISQQAEQEGEATSAIPPAGSVWVDSHLLTALHVKPGQTLRIGEKAFTIAALIANEPDRGVSFMNFAPRVMLNLDDLPATQLVQPGARVTYRLLLADPQAQAGRESATLVRLRTRIKHEIERGDQRGIQIEGLDSSRPEMRMTLARAERFLSLVSLLSSLLVAVAIAMAARRYMLRHLNACAMLRFLGMTQRQASTLFLLEFAALGMIGSALGAGLGFVGHFVLLKWLGNLVAAQLPGPGVLPAWQAFVTGMVLLLGFALPPLLQLHNLTLNRVLRRETDVPQALTLAGYALGAVAFVALLLWQAGEVKLGLLSAAGFLGGLALFALIAWLSLRILRWLGVLSLRWRPRAGAGAENSMWVAWRFALNALQRRPASSVVQIVALALGLMALLLLTVVRGQLIDAWKNVAPPDAPNRFIVNIQPDQKEAVEARLLQGGVKQPALYPMIRGRLVKINGQATSGQQYAQGRRMLEREFNLSTMADPPPQNRIVQGKWYGPAAKAEASVEEGLFKNLGLHLGDTLDFDIAGQPVQAVVTSVRKLDWSSMRVNFYVIINPQAMQDMPQTFITALHLPEQQAALGDQLVEAFPNLTVVDTGQIVREVQAVLNQVIAAVEFLFLFTLASGALVLYAVLLGSQDERKREAGLLRALGATRTQLARAQWLEFLFIGGLAGKLAATGAALCGWALARKVFEFEWQWHSEVWVIGIAAGVACAWLGGWLGLREVLQQPPLQTLREA